jgi:hypothetical protein
LPVRAHRRAPQRFDIANGRIVPMPGNCVSWQLRLKPNDINGRL